jgi:hypothetical protein
MLGQHNDKIKIVGIFIQHFLVVFKGFETIEYAYLIKGTKN